MKRFMFWFRCAIFALWLALFGIFLMPHPSPTPQQPLRDKIGAAINWPGAPLTDPANELVLLMLVVGLPAGMLFDMLLTGRSAHLLRQELILRRSDIAAAHAILNTAEISHAAVATAMRVTSGDSLENRLLAIETESTATLARLGETIDEHPKRFEEFGARTELLLARLTAAQAQAKGLTDGHASIWADVDQLTASHQALVHAFPQIYEERDLATHCSAVESALVEMGRRIETIESLGPFIARLMATIAVYTLRLKTADGDSEFTLTGLIEKLTEQKGELETAIDDAEGSDDPEQQIKTLTSDLDGFETRIAALETITPQALVIDERITALTDRLNLTGSEDETVSNCLSNLDSEKDDLETLIDDSEGDDDPAKSVKTLGENLDGFAKRIEALEGVSPKLIELTETLAALKRRIGKLGSVDWSDEIEALETLKGKIEERLDELDHDDPAGALEELLAAQRDFDGRIGKLATAAAGA